MQLKTELSNFLPLFIFPWDAQLSKAESNLGQIINKEKASGAQAKESSAAAASFFFLRHYICVVLFFSRAEDGSQHRSSCLVLLVIKIAVNT